MCPQERFPICKALTPEQVQQLASPTYRNRKNKETQKLLDSSGTSLSSHPGRLDGTTCMLTRKTDRSTVCFWSPEPKKLNSAFSRVARCSLPAAPPSRALSMDILRRWERAAREQTNVQPGCWVVKVPD